MRRFSVDCRNVFTLSVCEKSRLSNIVSKPNGRENVFTWHYLKGLEPREITTENVGLEKQFYGKAGELSVDNDITDLEDMFAPVIR